MTFKIIFVLFVAGVVLFFSAVAVQPVHAYYEDFEDPGNLKGTLVGDATVADGYLRTGGSNDPDFNHFQLEGEFPPGPNKTVIITFNMGGNTDTYAGPLYWCGTDGGVSTGFQGLQSGYRIWYNPNRPGLGLVWNQDDHSGVWTDVLYSLDSADMIPSFDVNADYQLVIEDLGETINFWVQDAVDPLIKTVTLSSTDLTASGYPRFGNIEMAGYSRQVGGIEDINISTAEPVATIDVGDGVEVTEAAGAGHSDTYVISMNYSPPVDQDSDTIEGVKLAMEYPNAQITVDPNANTVDVIFTAANWQTPQTVTVTAKDDTAPQGDRTVYIINSLTLLDPDDNVISLTDPNVADPNFAYPSIENGDVPVDILDDEQRYEIIIDEFDPNASLDPDGIAVSEQGPTSDTYTVVLRRNPTVTVMLDITTDGQTTVDPPALSFDSGNWDTPQTVTVTAVDDAVGEDDPHPGAITHLLDLPIVPVASVYEDFEDEIDLNVTLDPNCDIDNGYLVYGVGNVNLMESSIVNGGPYPGPTKIEMVFNMLGNTHPWTGPGIRVGYDEVTDNSLLIFWRLAYGVGQFAITDVVNGAWGPNAWLNVFGGMDLDPATDYLITVVDYGMRMDVSLTEAANPSNVLLSAKGVDVSSYTRLGNNVAIGSMDDPVNLDGAAIGEVTVTKGQALTDEEIEWLNAPILHNPTASIADNDCRADRTTKVADLDDDCDVDLFDFVLFASEWLDCTLPNVPGCQ